LRVKGTGQLGGQTVVEVVKGDNELALLVEGVLEVYTLRFGSNGALDGSLGLRCRGLSEQKARVFHAFGAAELKHTTAISDREGLVADVDRKWHSLAGVGSSCGDGGDFSLKVTGAGSVSSFDLDGVSGGLLHEVSELECLHLVLAEGAFEGERSLGSRSSSLQVELVLKVTKDRVLQDQVALALADHQRSEADLELSRLTGLESQFIRGHLNVLIGDGELGLVDHDLLVGRVLNDHTLRDAFADGAEQVDGLCVFSLDHSDIYLVHNVLSSGLNLESAGKLVDSSTHGHEVELVVLGSVATNVEHLSTAFE